MVDIDDVILFQIYTSTFKQCTLYPFFSIILYTISTRLRLSLSIIFYIFTYNNSRNVRIAVDHPSTIITKYRL